MSSDRPTGTLARVTLLDGAARALIAHTTRVASAARRAHGLSQTASAALGRALTGALMLASPLKGETDALTLSLRGGGPLGDVVCVAKPNGDVKGYVDHPEADPPRRARGKLDVGAAVGTDGYLTVIRDLGFGEPYIGRTPLTSGEVAEDISHYLYTSEQTPSLLALGVLTHPAEGILGSGGALLQPLPGASDEDIGRLEALSPRLANISALCLEASNAAELTAKCLEGLSCEILVTQEVRYLCDCSRERMEGVLISLGEKELRSMIAEQHGAEIICHFCRTKYRFTEEDLHTLLRQAKD